MRPTTSIEVDGFQMSLERLSEIAGGNIIARITTNKIFGGPVAADWMTSQCKGRPGAGEIASVTPFEGLNFALVEMVAGVTRKTAELAISRLLLNVRQNFPTAPSEIFELGDREDEIVGAMAVSSETHCVNGAYGGGIR